MKAGGTSRPFKNRQIVQYRHIIWKLTLGTALIIFGLSSLRAQDFKFGAKAGVNSATDTGDGEFDTGATARTGIHLGGVVQMEINEKLTVQGELLYSMQGFKDEVTHKLDYINLPIAINYFCDPRPGDPGRTTVWVQYK